MKVKSNLNPKRQTFYANYWSVKAIQSHNNPLSVHRSWPEAVVSFGTQILLEYVSQVNTNGYNVNLKYAFVYSAKAKEKT